MRSDPDPNYNRCVEQATRFVNSGDLLGLRQFVKSEEVQRLTPKQQSFIRSLKEAAVLQAQFLNR